MFLCFDLKFRQRLWFYRKTMGYRRISRCPEKAIDNSSTNVDEVSEDEAWKEELKNSLFENYGVIPEYYENLGDGIYQVYVEVGGEVVPLVMVDSATGDYQVNW